MKQKINTKTKTWRELKPRNQVQQRVYLGEIELTFPTLLEFTIFRHCQQQKDKSVKSQPSND